jgi:hypothetical protein
VPPPRSLIVRLLALPVLPFKRHFLLPISGLHSRRPRISPQLPLHLPPYYALRRPLPRSSLHPSLPRRLLPGRLLLRLGPIPSRPPRLNLLAGGVGRVRLVCRRLPRRGVLHVDLRLRWIGVLRSGLRWIGVLRGVGVLRSGWLLRGR